MYILFIICLYYRFCFLFLLLYLKFILLIKYTLLRRRWHRYTLMNKLFFFLWILLVNIRLSIILFHYNFIIKLRSVFIYWIIIWLFIIHIFLLYWLFWRWLIHYILWKIIILQYFILFILSVYNIHIRTI
jgi:hypothetical protein